MFGIDVAPEHELAGSAKKSWLFDAIFCIVVQGVNFPPSVEQPLLLAPYANEYTTVPAVVAAVAAVTAC
jgi:hypothetical protein